MVIQPKERHAIQTLRELKRALPSLTPEEGVFFTREALGLLQRMPESNLSRIGPVALAALGAAGTGALGVSIASTALEALSEEPHSSPARLGRKLLYRLPRKDPLSAKTAEAVFRQVMPLYALDHRARKTLNDADLVLRLPAHRASDDQRIRAVNKTLRRLDALD